jgi:hypothetical protein
MSDSNGLRVFWGDGEVDGENPQDFINGVKRSFLAKENLTEADNVHTFELWLKSGRAAKIWWNGLAPEEKNTWAHLRAVFEKKWPEKLITERTMEEQHAILEMTVLKEGSLGKRVKFKRGHVTYSQSQYHIQRCTNCAGTAGPLKTM